MIQTQSNYNKKVIVLQSVIQSAFSNLNTDSKDS